LLVHSRRLGPLLAEHNSAISYVDHPNLHGLAEKPTYRPDGFRLWVGDFLNLPYLLRWCAETGQWHDLRILTNARRTSLRGMAMAIALARRLGVELDVRANCVNGIPMDEWNPLAQRELMASARAALDIKGGEHEFAQYTKPPTKAHQFIVSGIPFATNNEAAAVHELLEDGFRIADVDDPERWLSREYWRATQAFSAQLEERIRPAAVAALYRRCLDEVTARGPARRLTLAGPRPAGPSFTGEGRVARLRAYVQAWRVLRGVGASWEDAAPRTVLAARAIYHDHVPSFVRCRPRDADTNSTRPPVLVSVVVDFASEHVAERAALSNHIPDTWEIIAHRTLRIPAHVGIRVKSIVRWPADGALRDRAIAAAQADGRYLAFVPQLDLDALAWVADASAELERRPDIAVIRRDDGEGVLLDPPATFVIRRDVWVSLKGYGAGASIVSPRCGDLDLLRRVRQLGYRTEFAPFERSDRAGIPPRPPRESGEIVVYTAITNGYDRLLPIEQRCVSPARQVAFLDESSRAITDETGSWEIREIERHDVSRNLLAKLPKIRPELVFPEAGYSLWVDGNVVLTYPFDIHRLVELYLDDADVCVFRHHARSCTYQEAEACMVRRLDTPQVIENQMARYRAEGFPVQFGLQELPVILRRHSRAVADFDRQWWEEIVRGSRRDQLSFQYVRWKTGLPVAEFPLQIQDSNGLFEKVRHRRRRSHRRPVTRLRAEARRVEAS
jgi:hypothetical protein